MTLLPTTFETHFFVDHYPLVERDKLIAPDLNIHIVLRHDPILFANAERDNTRDAHGGGRVFAGERRAGWELCAGGIRLGVGITPHSAKIEAITNLRALADKLEAEDIGFVP